MWRARYALPALICALGAAEASASFLDDDFWCRTYGCAVVHDGQSYDIYDNWQFATSSCCVQPGEEMVSYYSRAGTPLVTNTLDRIGPGPGDDEGMMLEVISGSGVYTIVDDGDGYLDASDTMGVFSLDSSTDIRLASGARAYSHSFYVTSRRTRFSLRAMAQVQNASGDFTNTIGLGDIKLVPSVSRRGNDGGWDYGARANAGNITIVNGVEDLGDLSSGPTQIMDFGRSSGIRIRDGDINEQVIRLDFRYEMPEYDLSMGTGELDIDVDFTFYREP